MSELMLHIAGVFMIAKIFINTWFFGKGTKCISSNMVQHNVMNLMRLTVKSSFAPKYLIQYVPRKTSLPSHS